MNVWEVTTDSERERCYAIRTKVFVEEQKVAAENERDAFDTAPSTRHVLAEVAGRDAATARLLVDGPGHVHIGRMAVHVWARGSGVGRAVMEKIHEMAMDYDVDGVTRVELSAQETAMGFYRSLGYEVKSGERYLDEGMWHQDMVLDLRRAEA
ncbi:GNAT family N-acetyltransferase [Trueperella pyogenes]|uniref:GNAT family N-acetyltransferase n=2 Tax=Trueperella pyogenes TaxID=1661 RepID=A0ABV3NA39_9ACTO|nr:GNAT family N-acetyltransferase [Trueperella pyogenes]AWA42812.1 GNAT family N-acetyltransferase [Trueperella pyogenes]AZR03274.1 GNAT family N-acetyltransferase [Trueperella pyogenes]UVJ56481.1 GNAT family N-acetyltransferase [Trueperella pyogenes]UVJ58506.1 GNAT family N-acetyltransferase [Trueperella pyogenes]WHU59247.1 GNAT family N-acetyltransferase [Trueperella pyogenes]